MEEESAFDILVHNLKALGYTPQTNIDNKIFVFPYDRISNRKFVMAKLSNSIYFLATDSFAAKAQSSTTHTGLYCVIDLPKEAECKIYLKDWGRSVVLTKKKKTGIKYIDERVIVTSTGWTPKNEIDEKSVDLFLEMNRKGYPYRIIIEDDYVYHVPDFRGNKILGVETNDWIFKSDDLKNLLSIGQELILLIINKA